MTYPGMILVNPSLSDCSISRARASQLPILHGRADRDAVVVAHALVDPADLAWAQEFDWHLVADGYAGRRRVRPSRGSVLLHREILGLAPGDMRVGDHINRDTLDNRRSNLRILTRVHHNENRRAHRHSKTSTHRGVSFRPDRGKWRAYASVGRKWYHLGYFATEAEAAVAARVWRLTHMEAAID